MNPSALDCDDSAVARPSSPMPLRSHHNQRKPQLSAPRGAPFHLPSLHRESNAIEAILPSRFIPSVRHPSAESSDPRCPRKILRGALHSHWIRNERLGSCYMLAPLQSTADPFNACQAFQTDSGATAYLSVVSSDLENRFLRDVAERLDRATGPSKREPLFLQIGLRRTHGLDFRWDGGADANYRCFYRNRIRQCDEEAPEATTAAAVSDDECVFIDRRLVRGPWRVLRCADSARQRGFGFVCEAKLNARNEDYRPRLEVAVGEESSHDVVDVGTRPHQLVGEVLRKPLEVWISNELEDRPADRLAKTTLMRPMAVSVVLDSESALTSQLEAESKLRAYNTRRIGFRNVLSS